jgi:Fe-S-cluster containining protein
MKETNACIDAGCRAACCHDIYFRLPLMKNDMLRCYPTAIRVPYQIITTELPPGVYAYRVLGEYFIRIIGPCPYLNVDYSCDIYDSQPYPCEVQTIASDDCINLRRRDEHLAYTVWGTTHTDSYGLIIFHMPLIVADLVQPVDSRCSTQ